MSNSLAIFLADFLIGFIPISFAIFWFSGFKTSTIKAMTALGVAWCLSFIIKSLFFLPRPYITYQFSPLVHTLLDGTFPSGHASTSFAVAFTFFWYHKKAGLVLLALAVLVGVGRILVGVHYQRDVMVGLLIGFFSSLVVKKFLHLRNAKIY